MNLTAQEIYEKEFHVDLKGYAPAEVDEFLDMVIEDYQKYDEKVEELQKKYNINKLLATILVNRGITEEKQIEKFLKPKRNDFYDPYGMPDMNIAVERIIQAIENREKTI